MRSHHRRCHHDCRHRPVPDAGARVHLQLGERRVVVQRIVNDAQEPVLIDVQISTVTDVRSGGTIAATPVSVSPAGAHTIAPGASLLLTLTVDSAGLTEGHAYRLEVTFAGSFVAPLELALLVDRTEPIVARHDPSRIRAWLKSHCLGCDPVRWLSWGAVSLRAPSACDCPEHHGCHHGHQGHRHGHHHGHHHAHV